ncbi:carbon dioxide-concentrating mechanism protein CcmK [Halomicronema sp. CCY15110]|uniref:carbon dioxide-concentrating mechanism protein CcmK n=1 Tax=Halomicronema sp. CCY15110 TaxID=2767773 RepID=UPI00194FE353|nr:BMC domain-containing protein [Halomicronema sp. CCY15110]
MVATDSKKLTLAQPSPHARRWASKLKGAALGMVSTHSFPAVVGTADAMLKSSDVMLIGYEKTGAGHCTAVVRGGVADVRMAVEAGTATAKQFGQFISSSLIPRPLPNLEAVLPICMHLDELDRIGQGHVGSGALGLLETRGFPAMVGAADAMTKAAEVQVVAHQSIGDGLCTVIIRGSLSNVAIAVEAGMHEAERIGELHAVMVIPRPLDDLEQSLPIAEALETEQPVRLPIKLEEKEKELVELPAAATDEVAQEMAMPEPTATPAPRPAPQKVVPQPPPLQEGELD